VETYAAVRQGGETLRRRRRPGRNIPPPRESARGNVRFAPPAKKIPLFFARRLAKGRKPVYLIHHARNSGRRSLETEQCNLTCGAEGPFPGPSARQ